VARTSLVRAHIAGQVSRACRLMTLAASKFNDLPLACPPQKDLAHVHVDVGIVVTKVSS
jgi:hypothetical protein